MDRRKILLGSGAAFATVLAGCSSSETGDDDPDSGSSDGGNGDGGNGGDRNGEENGTDDEKREDETDDKKDEGKRDEKDDKKEKDEKRDGKKDRIPGFKRDFKLESDVLTINSIAYDRKTVSIDVTSTTKDKRKLYEELRRLADDVEKGVRDPKKLARKVEKIDLTFRHDGKKVFTATVKVDWIVNYLDGTYSKKKFAKKVRKTCS